MTRFEALDDKDPATSRFLPFAVEASWITGRWDKLQGYLGLCETQKSSDFNVVIGSALHTLRQRKESAGNAFAAKSTAFTDIINGLRLSIVKSLNANSVTSLQSCHDDMLRLHALADVESIANVGAGSSSADSATLRRRLDVVGGYIADKQYLLGLRRATMELA